MKLFVLGLQPVPVDMGVNLRGGNIRVTQHLLNRSQIGPALQKMGGKRMPQRMRLYFLFDPGLLGIMLDDLPKALPADPYAQTA